MGKKYKLEKNFGLHFRSSHFNHIHWSEISQTIVLESLNHEWRGRLTPTLMHLGPAWWKMSTSDTPTGMGSEKGGESTMYCTEDQNEGGGGRIRERERRSSWELEEELLLYPLGLATVMRPRLHSGDEVHAPFGQTMREEKEEEGRKRRGTRWRRGRMNAFLPCSFTADASRRKRSMTSQFRGHPPAPINHPIPSHPSKVDRKRPSDFE